MFKKVVSLCLSAALAFSMGSTVAKAEEPMPEDVCADQCKSFLEDREGILEESEELDKKRTELDKLTDFSYYFFIPFMQFSKVIGLLIEQEGPLNGYMILLQIFAHGAS